MVAKTVNFKGKIFNMAGIYNRENALQEVKKARKKAKRVFVLPTKKGYEVYVH